MHNNMHAGVVRDDSTMNSLCFATNTTVLKATDPYMAIQRDLSVPGIGNFCSRHRLYHMPKRMGSRTCFPLENWW